MIWLPFTITKDDPSSVSFLPVAAKPRWSPWCVIEACQRTATRSPSVIMSSMSTRRSGKAPTKVRWTALKGSGPTRTEAASGKPCDLPSLCIISSIAASLFWFQTCSNQRFTRSLFASDINALPNVGRSLEHLYWRCIGQLGAETGQRFVGEGNLRLTRKLRIGGDDLAQLRRDLLSLFWRESSHEADR